MNLLDTIKLANDVADKLRNADLKQLLANVQMEAVNLKEELVRLKEENLALREAARARGAMVFRDEAYWQPTAGGEDVGPFCVKCWDTHQRECRLLSNDDRYYWGVCASCGHLHHRPGGRERRNADMRRAMERD